MSRDVTAIGERVGGADAHGTHIKRLRFEAFNPCGGAVFIYGSATASVTGWVAPPAAAFSRVCLARRA